MPKKTFDQPPRRVALFVTCMVDMMYPNVGMATVELLERFGVEVIFPEEQTCCGQPAFNAGFRDESRQLARRFIDIFEPLLRNGTIDAVVAPSGSCTTMSSHFYPTLFDEVDPYFRRAQTLGQATFELTEFLVDVLGVTDVNARYPGKLTYHACCHLLRELRVDNQPRALLANVQGAEITKMEGCEECCGFGGLFSIKNAGISTAMGERKVRNIGKSGADLVTLCDVSCMTHINGLLEKQGEPPRAVHIAEVLNQHSGMLDGKMVDGGMVDGDTIHTGEVTDGLRDAPAAQPQAKPPQAKPSRKADAAQSQLEEARRRRWQDY